MVSEKLTTFDSWQLVGTSHVNLSTRQVGTDYQQVKL